MRRQIHILVLALSIAGPAALAADQAVIVSAASPQAGVAPDSLATVFATNISTAVQSVPAPPWPTSLGDISVVYVTDAASNKQMARILYISPGQMNLYIPAGLVPGPGTVSFPVTGLPIGAGAAALRNFPVTIQKVAPALFSASGTGSGVAAANAIRVAIPTQIQSPVPVYTCANGSCTAVPIGVGVDTPIYLSLYGTGIRGASSLNNVTVTIGSVSVTPLYAGPQMVMPGLDQINVPLPISLRGAGTVNVTVTVDGVTSNAVQILIQ